MDELDGMPAPLIPLKVKISGSDTLMLTDEEIAGLAVDDQLQVKLEMVVRLKGKEQGKNGIHPVIVGSIIEVMVMD